MPLVCISKGKTERSERNWFGYSHHINSFFTNPDFYENPYFERSKSRKSSAQYFCPRLLTDHSLKGWSTNQTFKEYLKYLRTTYCPFLPYPTDHYARENR